MLFRSDRMNRRVACTRVCGWTWRWRVARSSPRGPTSTTRPWGARRALRRATTSNTSMGAEASGRLGVGLVLGELIDEVRDRRGDSLREFNKFHSRTIGNHVLVDVADAGVRNAALDDHGPIAKGESEIMKGIELKGKAGLHLHAAVADLADC